MCPIQIHERYFAHGQKKRPTNRAPAISPVHCILQRQTLFALNRLRVTLPIRHQNQRYSVLLLAELAGKNCSLSSQERMASLTLRERVLAALARTRLLASLAEGTRRECSLCSRRQRCSICSREQDCSLRSRKAQDKIARCAREEQKCSLRSPSKRGGVGSSVVGCRMSMGRRLWELGVGNSTHRFKV